VLCVAFELAIGDYRGHRMLSVRAVQAATAEEATQDVVAFSFRGCCCWLVRPIGNSESYLPYLYAFPDASRLTLYAARMSRLCWV